MLTDDIVARVIASIPEPIGDDAAVWVSDLCFAIEAEVRKRAIAAEREACAQACERLALGTLEAQSGPTDALENVMLRQVATLGHSECAAAIRARGAP